MASSSRDLPVHWCDNRVAGSCTELNHPADLFLEVTGREPAELTERALFALFDQIVDLRTVRLVQSHTFAIQEPGRGLALRRALAEALALFNADRFLVAAARVSWEENAESTAGESVEVIATLWGEHLDRSRHELQTEIKAVTYHQLSMQQTGPGTWRATILFDV